MEIYVIKHVYAAYEHDEVESDFKLFDSFESAKNYFEVKKETIIMDYLDHLNEQNEPEEDYTWENLINDFDDFHADESPIKQGEIQYPYFYCDLEGYGMDRIYISKEPVMKFES